MTWTDAREPRAAYPAPVALRVVPGPRPEGQPTVVPARARPPLRTGADAASGWVRLGRVDLRAARGYLLVWAVVLCGAMVLLLVGGYVLMSLLGVTASVSRALAVVLGEQLPPSGVAPVLQAHNVLPAAVLVSVVVSGLWLLTMTTVLALHNAVVQLTGGLPVRLGGGRTGVRSR